MSQDDTRSDAGEAITEALRDGLYMTVGLGVLAAQRGVLAAQRGVLAAQKGIRAARACSRLCTLPAKPRS